MKYTNENCEQEYPLISTGTDFMAHIMYECVFIWRLLDYNIYHHVSLIPMYNTNIYGHHSLLITKCMSEPAISVRWTLRRQATKVPNISACSSTWIPGYLGHQAWTAPDTWQNRRGPPSPKQRSTYMTNLKSCYVYNWSLIQDWQDSFSFFGVFFSSKSWYSLLNSSCVVMSIIPEETPVALSWV